MTKQTPEQIAAFLGKKSPDCASVKTAIDNMRQGEVVIGRWLGTAKFQGPVAMSHVKAAFPSMTRTVQVARGRQLGEDLFVVYGAAPTQDPILHPDQKARLEKVRLTHPDAIAIITSDEKTGVRFGNAAKRKGMAVKIGSGGRNKGQTGYQVWASWAPCDR